MKIIQFLRLSFCVSIILGATWGCNQTKSFFPFKSIQIGQMSYSIAQWSKDMNYILLQNTDGRETKVSVFDIHQGAILFSLPEQEESAHLSPEGNRIVTTGPLGVKIWDTATGQHIATLDSSKGHHSAIFLPNGNQIAVVYIDLSSFHRKLNFWENRNGSWQASASQTLPDSMPADTIELVIAGGKLALFQRLSDSNFLQRLDLIDLAGNLLWSYDLATEKMLAGPTIYSDATKFYRGIVSPNGKYFALNLTQEKWVADGSLEHNHILRIRDLDTHQITYEERYTNHARARYPENNHPEVQDLTFSEDSQRLVVLQQSTFLIDGIEPAQGKKVFSIPYPDFTQAESNGTAWVDGKFVTFWPNPRIYSLHSCGRFWLTDAPPDKGRPALWDIQTGDFIAHLDFSGSAFAGSGPAACSPDGRTVLIFTRDQDVYQMSFWDLSF